MRFHLLAPIISAMVASPAAAQPVQGVTVNDIAIHRPWARETAPAQTVGGGFVTLANKGSLEDRLISAEASVAGQVQLHTMIMDSGIMRMRQVQDGIRIPAKGTVTLRPGGFHLMFMQLKRPLRQGESFPVTLHFQRAGRITVRFAVQSISSSAPTEAGHAGH